MKKFISIILVASTPILLSGMLSVAHAQQTPSGSAPPQQPTAPGTTGMSPGDQMQQAQQQNAEEQKMQEQAFVQSALQGGIAEVALGKLAAQKGTSADVRQFGEKMVQDHSQLNDRMEQVAQQIGVRSPKGLSKSDKKLEARLAALSCAQFDDAYIKAMLKDHKKDLSNFKSEADNASDAALRQVAQQGAQVIDGHLMLIEQIAKNHNVKS